jgi:uridine phosphorylase
LRTFGSAGDTVSLLKLPTGAPAAAFLLEQAIACGARCILSVGLAGSVEPSCPIGTVVVAADALAGDGTSPHYSPTPQGDRERRTAAASTRLVGLLESAFAEAGVAATTGRVWTTDAVFRETPDQIRACRQDGAIAVDMESAAIYAVATLRQVDACSVVIVSDELWDTWRPGFHLPQLRRARELASAAVAAVARNIARGTAGR